MSLESNLLEKIQKFGDRTSSFTSSYPGFCSNQDIQYFPTKTHWVGGGEPLCSKEARNHAFKNFVQIARKEKKKAIAVPVSEELALQLKAEGFYITQIGIEPIIDLDVYFGQFRNPLRNHSIAAKLRIKGMRVEEFDPEDLSTPEQEKLSRMTLDWLGQKGGKSLSFLSQVDPFYAAEHKRYFRATLRGKTVAYLTSHPIYPLSGFYFADLIRSTSTPTGTAELLMIETMRILHSEGTSEVHLGICPLAGLDAPLFSLRDRITRSLFKLTYHFGTSFYQFKPLHLYKAKLSPTRWERLFLVSNEKFNVKTLLAIREAHLGQTQGFNLLRELKQWLSQSHFRTLLASTVKPTILLRPWPRTMGELLKRCRMTLTLTLSFVALHLLRENTVFFASLFQKSAFIPGDISLQGFFLHSVFHNRGAHLLGNLLSLVLFGGALEILIGSSTLAMVMIAGMFLSNPITLLMAPILEWISPSAYQGFLLEHDIGSSNGVYAVAGAAAALLRRPLWVLMPFVANALIYCSLANSWLGIHHIVGLLLGFSICIYRLR